jgi:hypothetical protein
MTAPVPSELKLIGMGVAPYSARGITQTLAPIDGSIQLRRTINGNLKDISDPLFQKYQSTISANDQRPPALDLVWPGKLLTVWCACYLGIPGDHADTTTEGNTTDGITGEFGRPAVLGSVIHEDGFTYYRPILTMRVTGLSTSFDEWAASNDWSLSLEEV